MYPYILLHLQDESLTSIDQGSESDAMSTRSTDSRRGEPNSPFIPVRQPPNNPGSTNTVPAFPHASLITGKWLFSYCYLYRLLGVVMIKLNIKGLIYTRSIQ